MSCRPPLVLVLGGVGQFGKHICRSLAHSGLCNVHISSRSRLKAVQLISQESLPNASPVQIRRNELASYLRSAGNIPTVLINATGPFQNGEGLEVASLCKSHNISYVDLSDSYSWMTNLLKLQDSSSLTLTGASTCPSVTSALVDNLSTSPRTIEVGISPGNHTERGLATVASILSYTGRLISSYPETGSSYGWQNMKTRNYFVLGRRWMSNIDTPEMRLFPSSTYNQSLESIRMYAGLEHPVLHLGMWIASWMVRLTNGIMDLSRIAPQLKWLSERSFLRSGGSDRGGMYVNVDGMTTTIIAGSGQGPVIPSSSSIIIAKKIIQQEVDRSDIVEGGSRVCLSKDVSQGDLEAHWLNNDIFIYQRPSYSVVIFDGECILCNRSIDFIVRHDSGRKFKILHAQSAIGKRVARAFGHCSKLNESVLVFTPGGSVLQRYDAVSWILSELEGVINPPLAFVPRRLLNSVYDMLAPFRYRVFGRNASLCRIDAKKKEWFITDESSILPFFEISRLSVYARVLGRYRTDLLSPLNRVLFVGGDLDASREVLVDASGLVSVTGGSSNLLVRPVIRLIRLINGLPPNSQEVIPFRLVIRRTGREEEWKRYFGSHEFSTKLWEDNGCLVERVGLFTIRMRARWISTTPEIRWGTEVLSLHLLGFPLPTGLLKLSVENSSTPGSSDDLLFNVELNLPFIGNVVRYSGEIRTCRIIHDEE